MAALLSDIRAAVVAGMREWQRLRNQRARRESLPTDDFNTPF